MHRSLLREVIYTEDFLRVWCAYPRKTGKGEAFRAFQKIRPSAHVVAQMLKAIEWQVHQPQWTCDGGQYIPHPSTWLNQRRWEDEPFQAPVDTSIPTHESAAAHTLRSAREVLTRPERVRGRGEIGE